MTNELKREKEHRHLIRRLRRDAVNLDSAFRAFEATARKLEGHGIMPENIALGVVSMSSQLRNLKLAALLLGGSTCHS